MQTKEIPIGPEPEYERVVSGYETFVHSAELKCEWGATLPEVTIAYETWGELSSERDNAVLLHTGLSASSHAHSQQRNAPTCMAPSITGPCSATPGSGIIT